MKYITYKDPKHDGVGEYPYFKDYLGADNDILSNTKFNLLTDDCTLYISFLQDNYDTSYLTEFIINLYDINIFNSSELKQYIESYTHYSLDIVLGSDGKESIAIIDPPPFNDLTDHKNINIQPFNGWVWNNKDQYWSPPIPKPNLNHNFFIGWNNQDMCWNISFERDITPQKNRAYQLWLAASPDGSSAFMDACSTRQYMIKSIENVTHSTRNMEKLISEYGKKCTEENEDPRKYAAINLHEVVIDLSPVAMITYSECNQNASQLFEDLYGLHPQCVSTTIHELFRLIIEWAYSYRVFSNAEPMAELCDKVLRVLQMPLNVRNSLLDIRPQQVGRFLQNDPNSINHYEDHIECPEDFAKWINKIYYLFTHVQENQNVHVDYIPDSYEM